MIAFKGFNSKLECTMGRGTFQYQVGKTYKESAADCALTGFHCVEEPIEVLSWYNNTDSRYCIVEAAGDIHEDGQRRISCTQLKVLKEITREQLGALECEWIRIHPDRVNSHLVKKDIGEAKKSNIVIVRGTNPCAAGEEKSTIFLLKEDLNGKIVAAGAYKIDGTEFKENIYYDVDGRRTKCRRKN